ncbi:hypothetical protein FFLO_04875 [Filobasidium floriforme]|uniref:WD40 repeat-like protein n=1 Tax=Filobasidium floriforme TaxID=5210 RepID=A0A8K0JJH4_9TREE|nr:hypothetical protein FFLO_04875 [Filobasidium floriforme]
MSTLISSVIWVPRGRASARPTNYTLDENELERVGKMGGEGALEKLKAEMERMELGGGEQQAAGSDDDEWADESDSGESSTSSKEGKEGADADADMDVEDDEDKPTGPSDPNDLSAYNLDNYDEEVSRGTAMGAFSNLGGLKVHQDINDDPYITLKEDPEEQNVDREALEILPSDSILITARTSSDLSSLDYHVYDEPNDNLYVHHDLMLGGWPLCVEWLDFPAHGSTGKGASEGEPSGFGNYIAVGTMDPTIEIWDMDMLDPIYPTAMLGPAPGSLTDPIPKAKGTGKKKKKLLQTNSEHHVSSVTSLSWSGFHRNLLLSSSADATVKLWDLSRPTPQAAIRSWDNIHPNEKVLAIEWNKHKSGENKTVVLSAGERSVKVWDTRASEEALGTGKLGSDVEAIKWDPWTGMDFFVSLENGLILAYDARTLSSQAQQGSGPVPQPKYTISAHDGPASALDVNPHIRGCIATGGMDGKVKIWNVNEEDGGKRDVSLAVSRDLGVGKVFTVGFSPDSPLTLAAAGSAAKVNIWEIGGNNSARSVFGPKLRAAGRELRDKPVANGGIIGVEDDDEDSDEE